MRQVNVPQKYEYLEHPADIYIRSHGKTLAESFANGGYALVNVLFDTTKVQHKKHRDLEVRSPRCTALLYDYLNALILLFETENFLVASIEKCTISRDNDGGFILRAILRGDQASNYTTANPIKAPTYHNMVISCEKGPFELEFVLDV